MEINKIMEYAEAHRGEFMEFLQGMVEKESYSYAGKEIKNICGQYIYDRFAGLGFTMEKIDAGELGFHMHGTLGTAKDKVLLVGHYDTVFETGSLKEMPFYIKDGKAHGPGVYDMKGGLAVFYMAVKAMKELGMLPDKTIEIFINCDEEAGSHTSAQAITECAKTARYALIGEPCYLEKGSVKSERFGRGMYKITAKGIAGHAGNEPWLAASPIIELSKLVLKIQENCDYEGGLYYSVVSFHGGEPNSTAKIPEDAYILADIRYKTPELMKKGCAFIENLMPEDSRVQFQIEGGIEKQPLVQNERNHQLYEAAQKICESAEVEIVPHISGGGSDGNFTSTQCATLDGMGLNGCYIHNPKEYIVLETIPFRIGLVAELIRTY